MELIAAVLLAGPLGYFSSTHKRGLMLYLIAWATIFPVQTIVVHSENPDDIGISYFVINAAILAVGVGLSALGARVRERRTQAAVSH